MVDSPTLVGHPVIVPGTVSIISSIDASVWHFVPIQLSHHWLWNTIVAKAPPWAAVPLIGGVRNYTSRAASQASIVPDQSFLHSIAVKVSTVSRVDFTCNWPVVEDFAALGDIKELDVLNLYRPVHIILLW